MATRTTSPGAAPKQLVAKAGPRSKTTAKAATTKTKAQRPTKKGRPQSQAEKVRAYLLNEPDARPIDVQKATGVPASYVWDIRAAMQRKGTLPATPKVEKAATQ